MHERHRARLFAIVCVMPDEKTLDSALEVMQETRWWAECSVSSVSALVVLAKLTTPLLHRIISSSLLWSWKQRNSHTPGASSNREVVPRKLSSIFVRQFCRSSSLRVCSRTSAHVKLRLSPRLVAAAAASFSSRSANKSGSHVTMTSGRPRRGSKRAMESDVSKMLYRECFLASTVGFHRLCIRRFLLLKRYKNDRELVAQRLILEWQ